MPDRRHRGHVAAGAVRAASPCGASGRMSRCLPATRGTAQCRPPGGAVERHPGGGRRSGQAVPAAPRARAWAPAWAAGPGPGPAAGIPAQLRHGGRCPGSLHRGDVRPVRRPARAVPSDAVLAAPPGCVPADLAQKLLLLAIFMLACAGAAALLAASPGSPGWPPGSSTPGTRSWPSACIIGQWALLLGYAGLPWALRAVILARARPGAARGGWAWRCCPPPWAASPRWPSRRWSRARRRARPRAARPVGGSRPPRPRWRCSRGAACPG